MSNNKQSTDDIQISLSLQSFISVFIFRLGQFLIDPDQKIIAGTRLSTILKSVFLIPEIKEITRNISKELIKITDDQWLDYFKKYFDAVYDQQLSFYKINETEISALSVHETDKAIRILELLGVKESLDVFARKVRFLIEDLLKDIYSGKLPELNWIDKIFTENPNYALILINASLRMNDKPNIEDILNKASHIFSSSFLHSPTVNVAEGIMEKEYEWGQADDASFNKSWNKINKEITYKVNTSDLELPKIRRISDKLNDLNEIVNNKTYFILREWALQDPLRVVSDAYNNKLANKLAIAVKHDVIDEIRKIVSKRQNLRRTESLYYTTGDGDETMLPVSTSELGPEEIIEDKNSYNEILSQLSPEESSLAILLTEGYSKKESAIILGHTASWVTKKLQSIQKRLTPLLNTN